MRTIRHHGLDVFTLITALSLIFGCVAQRPLSWNSARDTSYRKHVRDWTRTDQIYDGIIARSTATATCFSPAFSVELQRERSRRAKDDPRLLDGHLNEAREAAEAQLTFFVSLHTQNHYWNDLESQQPTFKVLMYTDDSTPITPTKIKRLNQNQMADWSTLFPSISPLDTGYFISFPPPGRVSNLRLLISGDPGAMEMNWRLNL